MFLSFKITRARVPKYNQQIATKKHTAGAAALWLVFLMSVVIVSENKGKAPRGPETKILK